VIAAHLRAAAREGRQAARNGVTPQPIVAMSHNRFWKITRARLAVIALRPAAGAATHQHQFHARHVFDAGVFRPKAPAGLIPSIRLRVAILEQRCEGLLAIKPVEKVPVVSTLDQLNLGMAHRHARL
jgi:hypothetical protein